MTVRIVERYTKARPFEERRKAPSPFTASRRAMKEKGPSGRGPLQQRLSRVDRTGHKSNQDLAEDLQIRDRSWTN